ncbi:Hypothetical predicted protein, partial [Olea europaea subsp. europaea]
NQLEMEGVKYVQQARNTQLKNKSKLEQQQWGSELNRNQDTRIQLAQNRNPTCQNTNQAKQKTPAAKSDQQCTKLNRIEPSWGPKDQKQAPADQQWMKNPKKTGRN